MISNRDYIRDIPILRKLKRCPFCGDNVNMVPMYDNSVQVHMMIVCMNNDCGAVVQFTGEEHPDEMTERWNRRTEK